MLKGYTPWGYKRLDDLAEFKNDQLKFNEISTYATCAGVFVGAVGVMVGILSIVVHREYLISSVRPHLTIERNLSGNTKIAIRNNGMGPL